ncbi:DedA family protein [Rossellomorea vietnamensis]|uniref:DedA family protein n=1 Tax=Rossellomorea vietnamensis TaxID=218284 RepID=A0A5D4MIX3_9BACI|nr:DedA family protein [Rossellomorea vietnamensis]TYS01592.1 DedA family protein [Rossellomorea vietnamensis]
MGTEWILQLLETLSEWGYLGIALGLMIEVIPSELVLSYGGFLVSENKLHFLGALLAGVLGGTMAQLFLYWLGLYGGRPFFNKWGKFLLISEKHLEASEEWFTKYGTFVIFSARFIPVVRHAISIPAGIGKMKFSLFFLYTFAAMIPWTVLFLLIGMELGNHWEKIEIVGSQYLKPIAFLAGSCISLYFAVQVWKSRKNNK